MDYMHTVFQSALAPYKNVDLSVKGFFEGTPGHLTEYDGYTKATTAADPPKTQAGKNFYVCFGTVKKSNTFCQHHISSD